MNIADIITWFFIALIVIIGLIGGYFQLMLYSHLDKHTVGSIFFGSWLYNKENLNNVAKSYRKKIILCWLIAIFLLMIYLVHGELVIQAGIGS